MRSTCSITRTSAIRRHVCQSERDVNRPDQLQRLQRDHVAMRLVHAASVASRGASYVLNTLKTERARTSRTAPFLFWRLGCRPAPRTGIEIKNQKSKIKNQKSKIKNQKSKGKRQKAKGKRQKAKGKREVSFTRNSELGPRNSYRCKSSVTHTGSP